MNRRSSPREDDKTPTVSYELPFEKIVSDFKVFLEVDLRRSERTVYDKTWQIKKFLAWLPKSVYAVSREDIRQYLRDSKPSDYTRKLKALKLFFRDFLGMEQVVETFKFKGEPFKPKHIYAKEQLQRFYEAIDLDVGKGLFLFYATSGLRKNEVLSLVRNDIDFSTRMVIPNCHDGSTKHSYVSFYNQETEAVLKRVMGSEKLFPISERQYRKIWKAAKDKTGLDITPQRLREWFCCEMGELGVSDRYIDAFCGRTPKSVLARHYSDYSPERLRQIYDRANLKVLA